jgi:RNA polymerase sigma factor (sigma-70 family)
VSIERIGAVSRHVQRLWESGSTSGLSDGQLLERFSARGDGAAFAALVDRHGPMVARVCRAGLGDPHRAQDTYQATFLVLARRAASIRRREAVGAWLHGVARRVAARARAVEARSALNEQSVPLRRSWAVPDTDRLDLETTVHEEIGRLPDRYRQPVVLCYLEGLTHDQAAERLAWPVGTVRTRLSWARERLRCRLTRRGLAPSAILGASGLARDASAPLPSAIADAIVRAAIRVGAGRGIAAGVASGSVVAIARGVVRQMVIAPRLAATAVALLAVAITATGAAVLAPGAQDPKPEGKGVAPPSTPDVAEVEPSRVAATIGLALRAAADIEPPAERVEALISIAGAQIRFGRPKEALETLRRSREVVESADPDHNWTMPHPIVRVAEAQAAAGDRAEAHRTYRKSAEIVESMKNPGAVFQLWSDLPASQLKTEGKEACRETLERYIQYLKKPKERGFPGYDPVTRVRLTASYKDLASALRDLNESDDFRGEARESTRRDALVAIAGALSPSDGPLVNPVIAEVMEAIGDEPDPMRKSTFLLSLAWVEWRLGRLDRALKMMATIDPDDVPEFASVQIRFMMTQDYLDHAEDLAKRGEKEEARACVRTALRTIEPVKDVMWRIHPVSRSVELLAKAGDVNGALGVAAEIDRKHQPYLTIARALDEVGEHPKARDIYEIVLRQARDRLNTLRKSPPGPVAKPSDNFELIGAIRDVARVQARIGDLRDALRTIEPLDGDAKREALAELAGVRAGLGDLDAALLLIRTIDDAKRRDWALIRLLWVLPASKPTKYDRGLARDPAPSGFAEELGRDPAYIIYNNGPTEG